MASTKYHSVPVALISVASTCMTLSNFDSVYTRASHPNDIIAVECRLVTGNWPCRRRGFSSNEEN